MIFIFQTFHGIIMKNQRELIILGLGKMKVLFKAYYIILVIFVVILTISIILYMSKCLDMMKQVDKRRRIGPFYTIFKKCLEIYL